jgi:uncharacterized membrane protein
MSELKFFLFTGVLIQNLNTMDLVKKPKTSHSNHSGHIEGDIMQNHEQKKEWKKVKNQDSMGKKNFFS